MKKLEEMLTKKPYNAGFGMFLFTQKEKVSYLFPQRGETLEKIVEHSLAAHDVY